MAEKTFLKALKMNPDYPYLNGQLQFMKNHLCDWVNYNETKQNIEKDITQNKKTITQAHIEQRIHISNEKFENYFLW